MSKIFSGITCFLLACPAFADEAPLPPPAVDADPTALILFAVVFVGMIGGFGAYIWWKERARSSGK